jgi:hypothetical protein
MNQIGFMPLLNSGDDIATAVVLRREMFNSIDESLKALYGAGALARGVFGGRVSELSVRMFGNSISPHEILERYTVFGVYASVMTPNVADSLAHTLIAGDSSGFRQAFRGHRRRDICPIAYDKLRTCPKCIEEDIETRGFAAWRVLHQLPLIGHCPDHGNALRDDNSSIRNSGYRSWPYSLPRIGMLETITPIASLLPMSDGYACYLKLWKEAFEGNLIGIKPDCWMLVMDAVVRHFCTINDARIAIEKEIETLWGFAIDELASRLHLPDRSLFVVSELEQRIQASYVASRLVICGALDALGLSPPRKHPSPLHFPIPLDSMLPYGSWISPKTQHDLSRWVFDANFPPALFRAMSQDTDIYSLAERVQIDCIILAQFIKTIPDELLYMLSMEQSWDRSSWLRKEMSLRKIG